MDTEKEIYEHDFSEEILSEEETKGVYKIQKEFLEDYATSKEEMTTEEWLRHELQKYLPEETEEKINEISSQIIESLTIAEKMKASEQEAIAEGRDRDSWFASTILQGTSQMSTQESVKYLQQLDDAVKKANVAMRETMTTKKSGYVNPSMNPNLDGYIAEQYHVNTFNLDAAAKGSGLSAEVQPLKPGETYTKNGFDVIIKDASGRRIHQYQMKFGDTAEDTIRMLKAGNYANQTIIVPEEQVPAVQRAFPKKNVTSVISHGNTSSKSLTKADAKELQKQAQNRNFMEMNWNEYKAKDLALGIGKQVGGACLQGAAIGAGMLIAKKVWDGEPVDGEEVIDTAISSGTDFGVKAATAAALKTASEKNILKAIPKKVPGSVYANIAFIAVENVKTLGKVATGELTATEGLSKMGETTAASIAGIATSTKVATIGATIGTVLGPVGTAVGGFVGGTVGYIVGSKVVQTATGVVKKAAKKTIETAKEIGGNVISWFGDKIDSLGSLFW